MTKNTAPSSIARTMAAALWPDVQYQKKLAKGVYQFDCAGHGGIIAVIGEADLDPKAVRAADKNGLIQLVVEVPGRTYSQRRRRYTSATYEAQPLRQYALENGIKLYELWVGEEDCDWATLALTSPQVLASLNEGRPDKSSDKITEEYCAETCERWGNEGFVRDLVNS